MKYDIIVCGEVLEHVSDPIKFMNILFQILQQIEIDKNENINNNMSVLKILWTQAFEKNYQDQCNETINTIQQFYKDHLL